MATLVLTVILAVTLSMIGFSFILWRIETQIRAMRESLDRLSGTMNHSARTRARQSRPGNYFKEIDLSFNFTRFETRILEPWLELYQLKVRCLLTKFIIHVVLGKHFRPGRFYFIFQDRLDHFDIISLNPESLS